MEHRSRIRWWEPAPEVVLGLGLLLFLLTEWDAARSALRSERALVLMAVVGVAWLVLRVVLHRLGAGWRVARTGAFGVGALAILAVVVLPAYDDTTVVETLTVQTRPAPAPTPAPASAPEGEASPPTTTTTTAPAGPQVVAAGELHGIDHRAGGAVRLYRQPTGALVVGLEDIDIQPGPDYDLYVVPGADREDKDGGVRLDDLRGNKGTQFYEVPAGTDLTDGPWTVLVWCQTFGVPVAAATPE